MRGEVFRVRSPRGSMGHERTKSRFAVIVQSNSFALSTWLVVPTSTSALPASFRPEVEVLGQQTRVLAEQAVAADTNGWAMVRDGSPARRSGRSTHAIGHRIDAMA